MPHPFTDLSGLDEFRQGGAGPDDDPKYRLLYSPVDDVHGALCALLNSATRSIVLAMYGFDDDELAGIMKAKMSDPTVYVQLTLDSSQASGVHEKALLAEQNFSATSVAIGRSEKGAIMHLKTVVIDASIVIHGSTNWSTGGEHTQDNELVVRIDPKEAAEVTTRIAAIHTHMLGAVANPSA